ncbi:uncharacterized protein VICG_02162, partial [Vittaforma corneae ATCC 50505]
TVVDDAEDRNKACFDDIQKEYTDSIKEFNDFLETNNFGGSKSSQIDSFVHNVINPSLKDATNDFEKYSIPKNFATKDNALSHFFFDIFNPETLGSKTKDILRTGLNTSDVSKCLLANSMMTELLAIEAIPAEFESDVLHHVLNFYFGVLLCLTKTYQGSIESDTLQAYFQTIHSSAVAVKDLANSAIELVYTRQEDADSKDIKFVAKTGVDKDALTVGVKNLESQIDNFVLQSETLLGKLSSNPVASSESDYRNTILNAINLMEMVKSIGDVITNFIKDSYPNVFSRESGDYYVFRLAYFVGYFELSKQMVYFSVSKSHFHNKFMKKLEAPAGGFLDAFGSLVPKIFVGDDDSDIHFLTGEYHDYIPKATDIAASPTASTALVVVPETPE